MGDSRTPVIRPSVLGSHGTNGPLGNHRGQVLIEYILMIGFAVGLLTLLQSSLRGTVYNVWKAFAKEISAGCPNPSPNNCTPDPSIK